MLKHLLDPYQTREQQSWRATGGNGDLIATAYCLDAPEQIPTGAYYRIDDVGSSYTGSRTTKRPSE